MVKDAVKKIPNAFLISEWNPLYGHGALVKGNLQPILSLQGTSYKRSGEGSFEEQRLVW